MTYRRNTKSIVLIVVALAVAVVTFITTSITVTSCKKGAASDNAAYYHQLEQAYVKEARKVMNEQGYFDAGITMTRRMNEDGGRIYTVKVHHNRLEKDSLENIKHVCDLLEGILFEDGEIIYEII